VGIKPTVGKTVCTGVEDVQESCWTRARPGDNVGILLRGTKARG